MTRFSERYGYVNPSDVLIREYIPLDIQNAICTCFDQLKQLFNNEYNNSGEELYSKLECHLWVYFLNKRQKDFKNEPVATSFLEASENSWYEKLDLVESAIEFISKLEAYLNYRSLSYFPVLTKFRKLLNFHFERLNFAYRVVNKEIVEITSKEEIAAIETALQDSDDNIRKHLSKALELYSKRPEGDYSNSIKESISAVEAYCREKTNENTLGSALNHLEKAGIAIPKSLQTAFEKLYAYTNQKETGIRHALMDKDGTYVPSGDEALFMLVSCSAFINYLSKKVKWK